MQFAILFVYKKATWSHTHAQSVIFQADKELLLHLLFYIEALFTAVRFSVDVIFLFFTSWTFYNVIYKLVICNKCANYSICGLSNFFIVQKYFIKRHSVFTEQNSLRQFSLVSLVKKDNSTNK